MATTLITKLPKQWKHWCRLANLRPTYAGGSWTYLKGRGRMWRVDCAGFLCCGDTYDRFDRWANSDAIVRAPMPKTEAEFLATVKNLVELIDSYVAGTEQW